MNKILTIILLIAFGFNLGQAQTLKQFKKKAQEAFENKNYYAALTHYYTIAEVDSSNMDIMYNFAEAARNYNAYTTAERSYQQVSNSEREADFPLANYWLAGVKKNLGKYEEAKTLYTKYLNANQGGSNEFAEKAKKQIEQLDWAQSTIANPVEGVEIEHLGSDINTPASEVSPLKYNDELYFSSFQFINEEDEAYPNRPIAKILFSTENKAAMPAEGNLNSETRHTAHATFNGDGSRIYFTICDYVDQESTDIYCQLYYKDKAADGTWGTAMKLPDHINEPGFTSTQPNIGKDKKTGQETLYYVSNRNGGTGSNDIWSSVINEDGSFSNPVAMTAINTAYEEMSPFYHTESNTLYYSTNGRKGLGGYDVYKIEKSGGNWAEISHMGAPINTSYNDIDYTLNDDESEAYLASNRKGSFFLEDAKEACCNDIYKVSLQPVLYDMKALTFNKLTNENLNGVSVELIEIQDVINSDMHTDNNEYDFKVRKNKEFILKATKQGFAPAEVVVSTDKIDVEDIVSKLYLEPYKMDLLAKTFDSETKTPLSGVTIKLIECNSMDGDTKTNDTSNDFNYGVDPEKCYKLLVTKPGYVPKTVEIKTDPLTGNITMKENIYLDKVPPVTRLTLEGYLPMPLYFDNDEPDKRSRKTITTKTYPETHAEYMARKDVFKEKYSEGMATELKVDAAFEIERFFNEKVAPAETGLKSFTDHLLRYLQQGNVAEIIIKGYTSPRAKSDYNDILAKRRISSIRNHFARYQGGIFSEFIAKGFLKVSEAPYGELKAAPGVSDDLFDEKNSIYSVPASIERRVEIIELK